MDEAHLMPGTRASPVNGEERTGREFQGRLSSSARGGGREVKIKRSSGRAARISAMCLGSPLRCWLTAGRALSPALLFPRAFFRRGIAWRLPGISGRPPRQAR